MLDGLCTTTDKEHNEFVGLKFVNGQPVVVFPRGYHLSSDDSQRRRDIVQLLSTIRKFCKAGIGTDGQLQYQSDSATFPFVSYQYILQDFLAHGYYTEREVQYVTGKKGKINWKRTIQSIQPQIDGDNAVYLDFYVKTNKINSNNLISKIHEYCVYDSFCNVGWLYFDGNYTPPKPAIPFNRELFLAVLNSELTKTFNAAKKRLFSCMINVISQQENSVLSDNNTRFGTESFEYVWEGLIDYVFGVDDKQYYFPHARWHIMKLDGIHFSSESSALEPDTIMSLDDKIYILDAKYYKYGVTNNPNHLPATSSIQKQITYGEYVDELNVVKKDSIFNAFVMPFDKEVHQDPVYKFVSVGTADWKVYAPEMPNYYYVLGILVDTKNLINTYSRRNVSEMTALSILIEDSVERYKRAAFGI